MDDLASVVIMGYIDEILYVKYVRFIITSSLGY